ncbi:MAG: NAD(P)(+) transhydrogenase (Re/Si-specific) subunit beta, partial [Shimia sp.]
MDFGFTIAAYAVAAVLFILSLGGLSGQESAKRAVWYGVVGMAIAVFATLIGPGQGLWLLSVVLIGLGGYVGYQLATRVQMTQMPELVAIMHSLVGLAAVFVGFNADIMINVVDGLYREAGLVLGAVDDGGLLIALPAAVYDDLSAFGQLIAKKTGVEIGILRVELVLGIWIGAVTFTGSVVAYAKLAGRISIPQANIDLKVPTGAEQLPGGHLLNAAAAGLSLILAIMYLSGAGSWTLVLLTLLAL